MSANSDGNSAVPTIAARSISSPLTNTLASWFESASHHTEGSPNVRRIDESNEILIGNSRVDLSLLGQTTTTRKQPDMFGAVGVDGDNLKAKLLLKFFNETFLSLPLNQCYSINEMRTNSTNESRNSTTEGLNVCLVDWQQVGLLVSHNGTSETNSNTHSDLLVRGDLIRLSDIIQEYPSKFLSFFKPAAQATENDLMFGTASAQISASNVSANDLNGSFHLAKLTYLSSSAVLSLIGILTNLVILTIIFINTKERYQHYFSCWYCCWWRMLGTGRGAHQYGHGGSNNGSRSRARSISVSNGGGGGANGNCITGHHYLLLFQLTITGLILSSYILVNDINIYQIDRQAQIINDYEQVAMPIREAALLQRRSHMARTLGGNLLMLEQHLYRDKTTDFVPWKQLLTSSPVSIFLPPTPFESKRKFIGLEQFAHCQHSTIANMEAKRRRRLVGKIQTSQGAVEDERNQLFGVNNQDMQELALAIDSDPILLLNFSVANSRDIHDRLYLDIDYLNPKKFVGKMNKQIDVSDRIGELRVTRLDERCNSLKHEQEQRPFRHSDPSSGEILLNLVATIHIWIVAVLAYDRYSAIAHPLEYLRSINTTKAKTFLVILWSAAILLNVAPPIMLGHLSSLDSLNKENSINTTLFEINAEGTGLSNPICLPEFWLKNSDCYGLSTDISNRFSIMSADLWARHNSLRNSNPERSPEDNSNWVNLLLTSALTISILNFLFVIIVPLAIITTCNISIYGIVKIHERRQSASSGSNGTGSLYHARPIYLDHAQNICHDRSDTCSIASSIMGKLIRASAQVGFVSASTHGKHIQEAEHQPSECCCCTTWPNETAHQEPSTAGSDLISFSPTKNYFLEDKVFNSERTSGRAQQRHRRDSIVSQSNNPIAQRSLRRLQAATCTSNTAQDQPITSYPDQEHHSCPMKQPCHSRLKQKLSDKCNTCSSVTTSRRSSFAMSECCAVVGGSNHQHQSPHHQCHHMHSAEACHSHLPSQWSRKQDSRDGIMHQLKMAGLSFAGIAISDAAHATPDSQVTTSHHPIKPQLHRSFSCSLWNLGSQAQGTGATIGTECRRVNNLNNCATNGVGHNRIQSSDSSQSSVNKGAQNHHELMNNANHLSRKSFAPINGFRNSVSDKYSTKVVDTNLENQFTLNSGIVGGHPHRDHSTRGHYFSLGTKSNSFNTALWMVLLLLIIAIPCYFSPIILQYFLRETNEYGRMISRDHAKLVDLARYLLQLSSNEINDDLSGFSADFSDNYRKGPQSQSIRWLQACFVWLSCICRVIFLATIPLHGWLYGIRSRSLKTTLRMVLRRYVSKKQATIEINQRRRSVSSLRSRDSSLYCFATAPNCHANQNLCHCSHLHQQPPTQHSIPVRQNRTPLGTSQSQEFSAKVFRRCASFNLTSTVVSPQKKSPATATLPPAPAQYDEVVKSPDTTLDSDQMMSVEIEENKQPDSSPTKHCNSIRFVLDDPLHQPETAHFEEASAAGHLEALPTQSRSLLSNFGSFLTPHHNGPSNNPSLSGSRYSSQNSSLNSSLADSSRSLLSASIQSSQSAAFMLLGEQASTNPTTPLVAPKPHGVLKKPQGYLTGSPVDNEGSRPSGCVTKKFYIDQIGRTKSLDHYQQQQQAKLVNGECSIEPSRTGRSSILKKFSANSIDVTMTQNQACEFQSTPGEHGQISPGSEMLSSSEDVTIKKASVVEPSNEITFTLTSVDQTEMDINDDIPQDLVDSKPDGIGQVVELVKSNSIDSEDSINQVDETTEMLPGGEKLVGEQISTKVSEPATDNVSQITETSSVRRLSESTLGQIRVAISKYLSNIKSKTSRQSTNVARRASSSCNRNSGDAEYDYSVVPNPLFRKYSDSTIRSTSSKGACNNLLDNLPETCSDNQTALQDRKRHCHRNKAMLIRGKSIQAPNACEHTALEIKRRNSLSSPGSSCTMGSMLERDEHSCRDMGRSDRHHHHHQSDHHHLKPPNCLKLVFDPDSHPPMYSSALALSPIRECSSNHSCASSETSLNTAHQSGNCTTQPMEVIESDRRERIHAQTDVKIDLTSGGDQQLSCGLVRYESQGACLNCGKIGVKTSGKKQFLF